jgi:hypothetical protein
MWVACRVRACSAGVLRVRSPEWGGSWVPLLDAAAARAATGSDAPLWPAWLEGGSLMAVVNSSKTPHPQVMVTTNAACKGCAHSAPHVVSVVLCLCDLLRACCLARILVPSHHECCPAGAQLATCT